MSRIKAPNGGWSSDPFEDIQLPPKATSVKTIAPVSISTVGWRSFLGMIYQLYKDNKMAKKGTKFRLTITFPIKWV